MSPQLTSALWFDFIRFIRQHVFQSLGVGFGLFGIYASMCVMALIKVFFCGAASQVSKSNFALNLALKAKLEGAPSSRHEVKPQHE